MPDDVPDEEKHQRLRALEDLQAQIVGDINARLMGQSRGVCRGGWRVEDWRLVEGALFAARPPRLNSTHPLFLTTRQPTPPPLAGQHRDPVFHALALAHEHCPALTLRRGPFLNPQAGLNLEPSAGALFPAASFHSGLCGGCRAAVVDLPA
jgi:hypothetical protein